MSYTIVPAHIQYAKGLETRFREHLVMDLMIDYEAAFDTGDIKSGTHTHWYVDDFSFTYLNGESVAGVALSWAAFLKFFAPFSSHFLEPHFFFIQEILTGYELFGLTNMYGNLHAPGECNKTGLQGRK